MPGIAHFSRCSSLMVGKNGMISEHGETKLCIEKTLLFVPCSRHL
jgi:hypothetical protein